MPVHFVFGAVAEENLGAVDENLGRPGELAAEGGEQAPEARHEEEEEKEDDAAGEEADEDGVGESGGEFGAQLFLLGEMGDEARLAWLVVIRDDHQRGVGADIGRRADHLD